jgi:hypothetical protein
MPRAAPSWRMWPQLRFLSRLLCVIGIHHWSMSKTLGKPILCTICSKKTRYYQVYIHLADGGTERINKDP